MAIVESSDSDNEPVLRIQLYRATVACLHALSLGPLDVDDHTALERRTNRGRDRKEEECC